MVRIRFFLLLVIAVTPALLIAQANGAEEYLFNGRDLTGWTPIGGGKWYVQNNEIIGETGDGRYGWLVTDKEYTDFILDLEFKAEAKGNSGIQFRSHIIDGIMKGYQAECDPNLGRFTGGVYEEYGRGWLAAPVIETEKKALQPNQWNSYRVQMIGDHIQTFLNGTKMVDLQDDRTIRGIIALQVHDGMNPPVKIRWRNIKITDLGYGEGWKPLFNGKNFDDWIQHGEEKWWVEDGAVCGKALTDKYGYLGTKKKYKDFIVRLKYKAEGTGNSGLFYHSTLNGVNIRGVQAEIDPTPGKHSAGLYESGGRGWIAMPNDDAEKLVRPVGEWNELQVRVKGKHIITHINGWQAVDFDNKEAHYDDGVIALQLHSGGNASMRWKDIYIKEVE